MPTPLLESDRGPSAVVEEQGPPPRRGSRPAWSGALTGLAVFGSSLLCIVIVSFSVHAVLSEDLRQYLQRTVEGAAALIDGAAHAQLTDSSQTDSPEYIRLNAPLRALLRTHPDIRFAFSGTVRGDSMYFVLDGDTTLERAWISRPDVPTAGEREIARTGRTVVEARPTPTVWGTGIRAFAPIAVPANAAPGPVAYVGVTMDVVRYDAWIRRVYETAGLGVAAAAVIALLIGLRTARGERRRAAAEEENMRLQASALEAAEERLLLEQRLQRRQKLEALGTMAGGVAHDFNNLLAVILGHAELLADDTPPGSEARDSVVAIQTAGVRARDVIRRILLFARPEGEGRTVVALAPLVTETVTLLRSTVPASVDIDWRPPELPICVMADPGQISQVLMNLGVNASQALHEVQGRITISLTTVSLSASAAGRLALDPGVYARLRVRDNGVGMSEEVRTRIFEPFFTTKSTERGTGLGLSVVEGVVRGHGGSLEVDSSPGLGSTFTIYLPAVPATGIPAVSPVGVSSAGSAERRQLLLVDDEEQVLHTMQRVLERAGYAVDAFRDANLALQALESRIGHYAAVITDRSMPEVSGIDVGRRVSQLDPTLPVLLLSGAPQDGDGAAAPFAVVLTKPTEGAALIAAIERAAR